ncbi:MAG: geranylgeranyl reductase family protein [Euryarchaeota archaeon]|nr:geranylgeranyl reductase family protein [Euryarchaeota archaeon]
MASRRHEVCVLGAGPAGASAAAELERLGVDCLLIDRARFPRSKPCGGVLPWRAVEELHLPGEVVERPLEGYRVFSPSGEAVESRFPSPGAVVRRSTFDAFLLDSLEGKPVCARVSGVRERRSGVELLTDEGRLGARYLIAADGANSVARRSLGLGYGKLALACQYVIALPEEAVEERIGGWFEVYYLFSRGYGWLAPLRGAVKAGVGGLGSAFSRRALERFVRTSPVAEKLEGGRVLRYQAHRIPMGGPMERLATRRVAFAGDAGGFVFPGTGEGIYYAIRSGAAAARAVAQALDGRELAQAYEEEARSAGLLSLRDVDFLDTVLASPEHAERYVRRLKKLARFQ